MKSMQHIADLTALAVMTVHISVMMSEIGPLNNKGRQGIRVILSIKKWRSREKPLSHRFSASWNRNPDPPRVLPFSLYLPGVPDSSVYKPVYVIPLA